MSFLNPGFLWLLPLAGIPLLIHLLGRQRFQVVEFSSLRFLKSLQADVLRRLKIRQIILLIIRTLLILCLILVFARPYRSSQTPGIYMAKGANLYLIVDNSASMSLKCDGRTQLSRGIEAILSSAKNIDFPVNLNLILATETAGISNRTTVYSLSDLERELVHTPETNFARQLLPAIALAVEDIIKNQDLNGVIWLVSDFQSSNWNRKSPMEQKLLAEIIANKIRLVLFPVTGEADNSALGAVHFSEQIYAKDKPVTLQSTTINWRRQPQENLVSLFIEEERVAQALINLPPAKSEQATFEFIPLSSGRLSGYLQIEDDDLAIDNRRFFILNIPATLRILVVGSRATDGDYIMKALQANPDQMIEARFTTSEYLGNEILSSYDGIIFSEVVSLSSVSQKNLSEYLQNGGGILIFLARNSTLEQFNALWAERFDLPRWHNTRETGDDGYLGVGKYDSNHPIFRDLWPENVSPTATPRFFKAPGLICGSKHKILMSFDDNTPLMVETHYEAGRAVMMATVPKADWSDLPFSGFFPVILQRMTQYIAGGATQPLNYTNGDTVKIARIPGENSIPQVQTPSGRRFNPSVVSNYFSFDNTAEIGIYSVIREGGVIEKFAVNLPLSETAAEFFSVADYKNLIKNAPANITVVSETSTDEISQLTLTREFSTLLLFCALFLAIAETFIGRLNRIEMVNPPAE